MPRPIELLYRTKQWSGSSGLFWAASFASVSSASKSALRRLREQAAQFPQMTTSAVYTVIDKTDNNREVYSYGWPDDLYAISGLRAGDLYAAIASGEIPPRRIQRVASGAWIEYVPTSSTTDETGAPMNDPQHTPDDDGTQPESQTDTDVSVAGGDGPDVEVHQHANDASEAQDADSVAVQDDAGEQDKNDD